MATTITATISIVPQKVLRTSTRLAIHAEDDADGCGPPDAPLPPSQISLQDLFFLAVGTANSDVLLGATLLSLRQLAHVCAVVVQGKMQRLFPKAAPNELGVHGVSS
jgi:hypothetical protein